MMTSLGNPAKAFIIQQQSLRKQCHTPPAIRRGNTPDVPMITLTKNEPLTVTSAHMLERSTSEPRADQRSRFARLNGHKHTHSFSQQQLTPPTCAVSTGPGGSVISRSASWSGRHAGLPIVKTHSPVSRGSSPSSVSRTSCSSDRSASPDERSRRTITVKHRTKDDRNQEYLLSYSNDWDRPNPVRDFSSFLVLTSLKNGRFTAEMPLELFPEKDLLLLVGTCAINVLVGGARTTRNASKRLSVPYHYGTIALPMFVDATTIAVERDSLRDDILIIQGGNKCFCSPPREGGRSDSTSSISSWSSPKEGASVVLKSLVGTAKKVIKSIESVSPLSGGGPEHHDFGGTKRLFSIPGSAR